MIIAIEGLDGAGKTTLARGLAEDLKKQGSVLVARPARESIGLFREMVGDDQKGPVLYQDVVPDSFRHAVYIMETVVQFRYRKELYDEHDFIIFDRWRQTWEVYCGPVRDHSPWMARIAELIPVPRPLFYLRVDPEVAARRLTARGDRWARVFGPDELRRRLHALSEGYEKEMAAGDQVVVLDGTADATEIRSAALAHVMAAAGVGR